MRATELKVGKTYNTGNYTSIRLDMTVELAPGDDMLKAKLDCEIMLDNLQKCSTAEYKKAQHVLANTDDFTGKQIKWATDFLASVGA